MESMDRPALHGSRVDFQLKPCPFCGGEATLHGKNTHDDEARVWCLECDIYMTGEAVHCTDEEATEVWNRRAHPTDLVSPEMAIAGTHYED